MAKAKKKKKMGRKLALSYDQHVDLIRRYRAGEEVNDLMVRYGINQGTVYRYINKDPNARHDAPKVKVAV